MSEFATHPLAWLTLAALLGAIEILTAFYLAMGFSLAAVAVAVILAVGWLVGVPLGLGGAVMLWTLLGAAFWVALTIYYRKARLNRPDVNRFDSRDSLSDADLGRQPKGRGDDSSDGKHTD